MDALSALQNLYNAVRQVAASAEVHEKLRECAVIIEKALKPEVVTPETEKAG